MFIIVRKKETPVNQPTAKQSITNDYERLRTITNDYEQLISEKQIILLYLLDHKSISRKEAASLIKSKSTKTYEVLKELMETDKLITKEGRGRATFYKLRKKQV